MHGGGFVGGSIYTHRKLFGHIAKAAGTRALSFDYRLAPDHTHPAQVDDATAAYRWLLEQDIEPSHVAFTGDSSGGGLTITAQLSAREQALPLPAAAMPLSPWADMEVIGESYHSNRSRRGELDPRRVHARARRLGHPAARDRIRLPGPELGRGGQGPLRRRELRRLGARARPTARLHSPPRRPMSEEADRLWAAIADPTRQRLLDLILAAGQATATSLARDLPITRQGTAKHLAILERAGLVEGRRSGREVNYTVRRDRLDQATRQMAHIAARWDQRLATIKRIAEARPGHPR
jgi:acetyl esterase/lipase